MKSQIKFQNIIVIKSKLLNKNVTFFKCYLVGISLYLLKDFLSVQNNG